MITSLTNEKMKEYAKLNQSKYREEKGLFILPSELFCNIRKIAKDNDNLNVILANTFDNIVLLFLVLPHG